MVDCPQERGADGAATLAMPEIDSSLAPKGMGDLDTTVPMEKYKVVWSVHLCACVCVRALGPRLQWCCA